MTALKPSVSVVIPCYNASPFLRETLESALNQTRPPLEIIVVDDGSTDDSAAIAQSYGPPVRVIRQKNQGESVARNRGIGEAAGDWIAFLDADDLWERNKLERQLSAAARSDSGLVCIYSDFYWLIDGVRSEAGPLPECHLDPDYRVGMIVSAVVNTTSALVKRDVANAIGFPTDMRDSEDRIFFMELRERGPFLRIDEPLVAYRRSSGQQTSRGDYLLRSVRARYAWFQKNHERYRPEEQTKLKRALAQQLVPCHDWAYWRRDHETAQECRMLFRELHPDPTAVPDTFRKRLYPGWLVKTKDWISHAVGGVRGPADAATVES